MANQKNSSRIKPILLLLAILIVGTVVYVAIADVPMEVSHTEKELPRDALLESK